MASEKGVKSHAMWFFLVLLTSQQMLDPVESRKLGEVSDQKSYSPDPHHHTSTPSEGIRKPACIYTTPSTPFSPSTPSSPSTPLTPVTPSVPFTPRPSTPSTPSQDYTPSPHHGSTPSHGNTPSQGSTPHHGGTPSHGTDPTYGTPSAPSHGGGGYYNSPTVPVITPPSTPFTPTPLVPLTPTTPLTPPVFPVIHTPPTTPVPFDPNTVFPGTCYFWSTHPMLIWGLLGYWGTIGGAFSPLATSTFGQDLSFPEALSNTRTDGIGALFREGTASLLNSMVDSKFPFTTQQVRDAFMSSLHSNSAAAAQAKVFKKLNERHLKH
ncbi:Protodermal factor 1.1 [Rhynchospora pubera]|uniref:Protodermal factor 1.1 n=1 Tax=Rhynchospora pubera TaxID=906938 RepID=A0AAV8G015_9POAL|nr:Protodermal factor 1.1 [Rhynchospora pubera]